MFILIFEQLLKMFFIMLLAFICYKLKLFNQEGNRTVSDLLLLVVNPCVILTVYQTDYNPELVKGLLLAFAASFLSHVIAILLSNVLIRPSGGFDYSIERYHAIYSNCGFIGIPLIGSVLGDSGVFFLTAYMVIFNLFSWTHGVVLMEKKSSFKSIKEGLLSPIFISTVIAIILFFLQIRIPRVLLDPMDYLADMNTPLAMLVAGFSVAQADLGKMFRNIKLYYVSFIKLVLLPAAIILTLKLLALPVGVAHTVLIATACPAATTGTMMAIRFRQNYTYASELFAFSTVLSVVTIPFIVLLGDLVL